MPRFELAQHFAFPPTAVFDFMRRPANILQVAPPDFGLRLLSGPERLEIGAQVAVEAKRWGFTYRIVNEVVELVEGRLIVEEQREGPLPKWRHVQHFEPEGEGTCLTVTIDYQTPGGLAGLVVTPRAIESDLLRAYTYREGKVKEFLSARSLA